MSIYPLAHSYLETHNRIKVKHGRTRSGSMLFAYRIFHQLENVFVKHYAPNHMPDHKGEWSLKENNSELHYGICSKVNQFIYTLVCNYMYIQNIRILAKAVLQLFCSQGCSYTKCLCPENRSNSTKKLWNRFKS